MRLLRRDRRGKHSRADLEHLSDRELDNLYWRRAQEEREPQLRDEERRLGAPDWNTAPYIELLRRSIARFNESRRPDDLRKAKALGIPNPERLSTDALHWAVFGAETRERRLRELAD